jgi:hypothetical protein
LRRLGKVAEGMLLVKICKYLIIQPLYSDGDLMRHCKINRYRKNVCLDEIGAKLLRFNDVDDSHVAISTLFVFAKRLMWKMDYDASALVVENGIDLGGMTERYQWVIEFWDLLDDFPEMPTIEGMSRAEARQHQADLNQLGYLLDGLDQARLAPTAEIRTAALERIRETAIQIGGARALSVKNKGLYYKVMAKSFGFQSMHPEAIPYQEALLKHLAAHPEIAVDPDHAVAKESWVLAQMFQRTGRGDRFREVVVGLNGLESKTLHSDYQLNMFLFPVAISIPLDKGDLEGGSKACQTFLDLLDNDTISFPPRFVTQSLYFSACFYFAANNSKALSKVLKRLGHFTKASDFKTGYFTYHRLLRLLRAIDIADWEDAALEMKWLRSPKFFEDIPGLKLTLEFLESLMEQQLSQPKEADYAMLLIHPLELSDRLKGLDLLNYLDVVGWLEAKKLGCPLLEVFRQRASQA